MNHSRGTIRDFLEELHRKTQGLDLPVETVHSYVLRKGREFESQELTKEEAAYANPAAGDGLPERECYRNAQLLALAMPRMEGMELRYVEGYFGINWGMGVPHAWLSLNGKVVDPTIRTKEEPGVVLGALPEGFQYFGVELDPQECEHALEHREGISLVDDWRCHWPMMRQDERG